MQHCGRCALEAQMKYATFLRFTIDKIGLSVNKTDWSLASYTIAKLGPLYANENYYSVSMQPQIS